MRGVPQCTSEPTYQEQKPGMSQPRWWHRRLLGSPPPMATPNLQLHTEQFPLKEIQKLAKWFLHMRQMNNYSHLSVWERLSHPFTINSAPGIVPYSQVGTTTPSFSLKSKGFASYIQNPTLKTPTRGMGPHSHQLWKPMGWCVPETHKTMANGESIVKGKQVCSWLSSQTQHRESKQITHLSVFPWKWFICIL